MKAFLNLWQEPLLLLLFYVFVAAALIAPIAMDNHLPALADYTNHLAAIIQAKMALAEGQFPIRVMPMENFGWRYPLYQFYAPTTYTFAALIYKWFTPTNPLIAFKITIWSALVFGGIYMNRLAYWLVKSRPAALLASFVYLTSPYYIIVINDFGDLSEAIALAIVPAAVFYSLKGYLHTTIYKNLVQMGLVWYLLITTHVVTFIYTALFVGTLLLFITFKNPRRFKNLVGVGIALLFGCLLAMWYIGPIALIAKYLIVGQTFSDSYSFNQFNPVISQLLFPGASLFQKDLINNHPAIGWLMLGSVSIVIYALCYKLRIQTKRANYWLLPLLILFLIGFFIIWSPVDFWRWLPHMFLIGQYSWRLLDQLIWIGTLLFAWAVCWLFNNKLDRRHIVLGILLIAAMTSPWFPTLNRSNIDLQQFMAAPYFVYNQNAYSMNFNKHTQFVDYIDTIDIYLLKFNNTLQLNTVYSIPKSLLNHTYQPMISLEGNISDKLNHPWQLNAIANNSTIETLPLQQGKIKWNIAINQFKQAASLKLQFKMDSPTNTNKDLMPVIAINKLSLTGFFNPTEILRVNQVQPFCKLQKSITQCTVKVANTIKMLELPIIYYPHLFKITLNGKKIPYYSIVYFDNLIMGIVPEQGKTNIIKIEFRGLEWANTLSKLSWGLWSILLLSVILTVIQNKMKASTKRNL